MTAGPRAPQAPACGSRTGCHVRLCPLHRARGLAHGRRSHSDLIEFRKENRAKERGPPRRCRLCVISTRADRGQHGRGLRGHLLLGSRRLAARRTVEGLPSEGGSSSPPFIANTQKTKTFSHPSGDKRAGGKPSHTQMTRTSWHPPSRAFWSLPRPCWPGRWPGRLPRLTRKAQSM